MEFVLISQQGSGTNLLRAIANSHPSICMFDELFCTGRNWETYEGNNYKGVADFLNKKRQERVEEVVGFDLKYNQINKELIEYIHENDVKVIHFYVTQHARL